MNSYSFLEPTRIQLSQWFLVLLDVSVCINKTDVRMSIAQPTWLSMYDTFEVRGSIVLLGTFGKIGS